MQNETASDSRPSLVWLVLGSILFLQLFPSLTLAQNRACETKIIRCLTFNESMRSYCLSSAARLSECSASQASVKLITQRVETYRQSVNVDIPLADPACINAFDLSWSTKLSSETKSGADYDELAGQLDRCSARAQFRIPQP